jgi:pre-rRNA-processing protein TSR3
VPGVSERVIILRHHKERASKCSLRPLRDRPDFRFVRFPERHVRGHGVPGLTIDELNTRVTLSLTGPVLSPEEGARGFILVDGTWRWAGRMEQALCAIPGVMLVRRSLPPDLQTAYPRRANDEASARFGLASAEALYAAFVLCGYEPAGLLDAYPWAEAFIKNNPRLTAKPTGS